MNDKSKYKVEIIQMARAGLQPKDIQAELGCTLSHVNATIRNNDDMVEVNPFHRINWLKPVKKQVLGCLYPISFDL